MTKPLVSIVLPTYNGARFLEKSVQSCLDQTYSNVELIIVDDASTDATSELIEKLRSKDDRIRSLRHATNRKLPGALNSGFSEATGSYLTWTSDDNMYRPNALATMVTYLESNLDVDMVYTDFTEIDDLDRPIQLRSVAPPEDLVNGNRIGACFLYKRKVYEELGSYAEDLFLAEDYDFWLRAAIACKIQQLHEDCYLYRLHTASLSTSKRDQVLGMMALALLRHLPKLHWVDDSDKGFVSFRAAMQLEKTGRTAEATAAFRTSIIDYRVLDNHRDYVQKNLLYAPINVDPRQEFNRLLSILPSRSTAANTAIQMAEAGRTSEAITALRTLITRNYAMNELPESLYPTTTLRAKSEFHKLLDMLPAELESVQEFKRHLQGQYYGVKCFEAYTKHQFHSIRQNFLLALRFNHRWIRNRGFLRIALRAFLPHRKMQYS